MRRSCGVHSHQHDEMYVHCSGHLEQHQVQLKSNLSSPGDLLDIGKDKAAKEAVAITPGTANGAVQGVQVSSFVDIDLAACLILCKHQGCSKTCHSWYPGENSIFLAG